MSSDAIVGNIKEIGSLCRKPPFRAMPERKIFKYLQEPWSQYLILIFSATRASQHQRQKNLVGIAKSFFSVRKVFAGINYKYDINFLDSLKSF